MNHKCRFFLLTWTSLRSGELFQLVTKVGSLCAFAAAAACAPANEVVIENESNVGKKSSCTNTATVVFVPSSGKAASEESYVWKKLLKTEPVPVEAVASLPGIRDSDVESLIERTRSWRQYIFVLASSLMREPI